MKGRKSILTIFAAVVVVGGLLPGLWSGASDSAREVVTQPATQRQVLPITSFATFTPRARIVFRSPTPSRTPFVARSFTPTCPRPTATKTPIPSPTVPDASVVLGVSGYGQLLPLSCESRSAADWARHFGVEIHELEFLNRLPKSNDPEEGFVGSPYGSWGQIPPNPYGVHAGPVARLLNQYGVKARAGSHLTWAWVQREIAVGRPVMVWVTGHVEPGKSTQLDIDGKLRIVARYEHTVILFGYNGEEVDILDGNKTYRRPLQTFLASWGALENMAIYWDESLEIHAAGSKPDMR